MNCLQHGLTHVMDCRAHRGGHSTNCLLRAEQERPELRREARGAIRVHKAAEVNLNLPRIRHLASGRISSAVNGLGLDSGRQWEANVPACRHRRFG